MSFEEFIQDYDFATVNLIIDATDNLFVRQQIDRFAKSISVCWIYGSVEEFNGQICFFDKGSFFAFQTKLKKFPDVEHLKVLY